MRNRLNEAGRTMLEMMAVLAIMGIIMYGAIVGIGFGVDMYKVTATYNDLEEISQTVIDLYSWAPDYPTAEIDSGLICANSSVQCENNSFAERWPGMTIKVFGESDYFYVQLKGLSKLACNRLLKMPYQHLCISNGLKTTTGCNNTCDGTSPVVCFTSNYDCVNPADEKKTVID